MDSNDKHLLTTTITIITINYSSYQQLLLTIITKTMTLLIYHNYQTITIKLLFQNYYCYDY